MVRVANNRILVKNYTQAVRFLTYVVHILNIIFCARATDCYKVHIFAQFFAVCIEVRIYDGFLRKCKIRTAGVKKNKHHVYSFYPNFYCLLASPK